MSKVREKWNRVVVWFATLWINIVNLGKETPRKTDQVSVKRDNTVVYTAAKEYLTKKKKFKNGDILEWIPECKAQGLPLIGEQAIVVGFDIPKFPGNQSNIDPKINCDINLLVQHSNGNCYIFPFESWRFRRIGSIFLDSETKRKKSGKNPAVKKKSAVKKRSEINSPRTDKPRGLEAIQQFPQEEVSDQIVKPAKKRTKRINTEDSLAVA
ncbi:unnamed protein product [Leptospira phage LE1]|uniref:Uncharacterized protein n=1 Tax=Leptospira phage LE1 TaxID=137511 RepID=Q6NDX7_9CAUD|nr:hypothetical protein HWD53_gp66 [Leptospira phage LE1]CAE14767.1 unnamed protein product [Leptospira phage LE1]